MDGIFNILPCGYLTTNHEGKITFINKYLARLLSMKESEMIEHKFIHDLLPMGANVFFETHINPSLKMQGAVEDISIELIRIDKMRIPVLMNAIVKRNKDDELITVYTFFDISQRKVYERELLIAADQQKELSRQLQVTNDRIQKDNTYYRSIIENKSFYILKLTVEGKFTYLNPSFCKKLGIEEHELLGKSALSSVILEDHALCIDAIRESMVDTDQTQWVTIRTLSPDGILSIQWEFSLLKDDQLNTFEVLCIGHDITLLIEKQNELQAQFNITELQNSRLNNFAYITSHNVRSHVANLIGIIEATDLDDQQDRNLSFGMLKKSAHALDETIKHLNTIISIHDNTKLPRKTLAIKEEINKVMSIIGKSIATSRALINVDISNLESLHTNPAYFESIILNLLTNAIKYRSLDRDPKISIRMIKEGNYKVLMVSDNGLGIDLTKYNAQIFGMYKTFHGNRNAKGIGLFITKLQIEAMNGKIEVYSELDVGTTFKVYFHEL